MTNFTPEQLQEIQQMIQSGAFGPGGRSPIRERQLHDLRLVPTATDPRPLFLPSAEEPRGPKPIVDPRYPTLRWHKDTGQEIAIRNLQDEARYAGAEWVQSPPSQQPLDPIAGMAETLAALSDKERDVIFRNQKTQRMQKLQDQMAALSDDDLEALLLAAKTRASASADDAKSADVKTA